MTEPEIQPHHILVLYDGVCALCNGTVSFLVKRDDGDRFRFAPLQSNLGREIVRRYGGDPDDLDTVYVVLDFGESSERILKRSRAVLTAVAALGGPWKLASVLRVVPGFVTDLGYRLVARVRYRLFGKYDACPLPEPAHRHKFLATTD